MRPGAFDRLEAVKRAKLARTALQAASNLKVLHSPENWVKGPGQASEEASWPLCTFPLPTAGLEPEAVNSVLSALCASRRKRVRNQAIMLQKRRTGPEAQFPLPMSQFSGLEALPHLEVR